MKLLFALIALPLIEIMLFIEIGGMIGITGTLIIILLSAILGIHLLRKQSFSIVQKMKAHQGQNTMPEDVFSDICKFIGAILLIVPGFFTDFLGLLLYIPAFETFLFKNSMNQRNKPKKQKKKNDTTIIDVEYIEIDEDDSKK